MLNSIGNTPLIELKKINELYNLKSKIYAKLEYLNPTGSVKDRTALGIINDLYSKNLINKNTTLVIPTSGNMGISLAYVGNKMGLKVIVTMPNNMGVERVELIQSYNASVVLTKKEDGMEGAIKVAKEISNKDNYIFIDQFNNEANVLAHINTGKEIYIQNNKIDYFINGIGSGGTITGVTKYLKSVNNNIKSIGIEPEESPLITKGYSNMHEIFGIGANFIPSILDLSIINEVERVSSEDAIKYFKLLNKLENLECGISSGANLKVAIEIAQKNINKNIVIILPDKNDRYKTYL